MENNVSTAFMAAAKQVLQEIGFPHIQVQVGVDDFKPSIQNFDILAMIGLVGDLRGYMVFYFPPESSMAFVDQLSGHLGMHGENAGDPQYRKSALSEISNQIGGKATILLSGNGVDCMITPPTILSGSGIQAALPDTDNRYAFSVSGDFGFFSCTLAVKNSKIL